MRTHDRVAGYLSSDGKSITTWSGGHLADVTSEIERRTGRLRHVRMTYWKAVGQGRRWYGAGLGRGMSTLMRATMASK